MIRWCFKKAHIIIIKLKKDDLGKLERLMNPS